MINKIFVGGKWIKTKNSIDIVNPYNNKKISSVYIADKSILNTAIKSAVNVFEETKSLLTYQRSEALLFISNELNRRRNEIAKTLSKESGKPLKYAFGEVTRAASTFKVASEVINTQGGEVMPLDITPASGNRFGVIKRFPIGPIFGICPFNFPLNLVAHKVAPAIASGNPIIIKPASKVPLTALILADIFDKTKLPKETLQIIPCDRKTADEFISDERIKMISFTGSVPIGWDIKNRSGKKKVVLELGGDAAVYIDESADMDYAVKRCVIGAFAYSGQVCISIQRMFIHEKIYDEFILKFVKEVKKLIIGNPILENTDISSIIDSKNTKRILNWIDDARLNGSNIIYGGKFDKKNNTILPTIIENPSANCLIMKNEAFAPIVNVFKVKDGTVAIKKINASQFGLQAGIFTNPHELIMKAFDDLDVGGLVINDVPTFRVDNMPYGGVKDSGFGREGVKFAIDDMTEIKIMVINQNNVRK
ncbi:aldehyde dehydrogenase family protein [Candidatus Woesearchaeota archaeon]|nr:aldehyde dehydrogenase family protein [Candidatus Woesearchaeota archaeon]